MLECRHDHTGLQEQLNHLQLTNKDLMQELSATSKQLQRLSFEAQTAIDIAGLDLSYREFIETIRAQEADINLLRKELKLVQKENVALKKELKMHRLKTFPLDADTTGYLFTFFQDLPSLFSTSLSCRFFYEVFKAGSQAITRAVALNQIGPMLPQALRLARTEARSLHRVDVGDLPKEDSALSVGITGQESVILARNAKTVFELENLFSWKKKDRRSKISVLTNRESLHFQRALYRIMLLSFVHGMRSISRPEFLNENFASSRPKQKNILEEYSKSELCEIEGVVCFLQDLALIRLSEDIRLKLSLKDDYHLDDLILFMGPCFILQCYTYRNSFQTIHNYCNVPFDGFIIEPLHEVLEERYKCEDIDSPYVVLDSIYGADDKCPQCGRDGYGKLVNNTCWSDLKGLLHETLFSWSHELLSNPIEIKLQETLLNLDLSIFMDTLFDARSGSYSSWRKDEWICASCLSSLWLNTLSIWWLKQKREAGVRIERDCGYGFRCTKQYDLDHARRFNVIHAV